MEQYLLASFDFVTVGNRTSRPLTVTFDGKSWVIPAHPATVSLPRVVAIAACRQHVLMGSEDPVTQDYVKLVYVAEWEMPCEPLEQSAAVERLDRSQLSKELQATMLVQGSRPRVERDNVGAAAVFTGVADSGE